MEPARRVSVARNLSHPVITGKIHYDRKDSHTALINPGNEDLVDMYIEDVMQTGTKSKKKRKERNIRAQMGFFSLIWRDVKLWYNRLRMKHQENPFLKSYIKEIESNFGSGIGALFVFIRWVFISNIVLSILWLGLVVLPTAVTFPYSNVTQSFAVKNVFDGQGAVSESWLFYGAYPEVIHSYYYLALLYLFLIVLTYFGSLFLILKSIGEGNQPALSSSRENRFMFSMLLLTSWDHSITTQEASTNLSKGITSILKDNIYEAKASAEVKGWNRRENCKVVALRCLAWFLTILLIGGGCTTIVYLVIYVNFNNVIANEGTGQVSGFLSVYGTTMIFSLINIFIPMCISQLPRFERYVSGKQELNITVARVFCLRMANLLALIVSLYSNISEVTVQSCMAFGRYYWTLQKREFNLSGAALVLIYRQGLVWVGTIACPVLPLIGALSIAVFFFINYHILTKTCRPPIKRWNQSRNISFLMGFLLITIMFIILPVSVIIGSHHVIQLGTSSHGLKTCGPFGTEKPTVVFTHFRLQQVPWLQKALTWLVSDSVLIAAFLILLAALYYQRILLWGERKYSLILQAELAQERKDIQELMRKVQGYV